MYYWSHGVPVCAPAPVDGDAAVETEGQSSRADANDSAIPESMNGLNSTSAPTSAPVGNGMLTLEEFRNFVNESWALHRRLILDARIKSASLYVSENQLQRLNESQNAVLRRLNRWARFVRVNHSVCNISCMRETIVDIFDRVAAPDTCADGDSDLETGQNM